MMKDRKKRFGGFVMRRNQISSEFGGAGIPSRNGARSVPATPAKFQFRWPSKTGQVMCLLFTIMLTLVGGQFLFMSVLPESIDKHEELSQPFIKEIGADKEIGIGIKTLDIQNGDFAENISGSIYMLGERETPRKEILVMGFHHSGTSLIVKFLNMLGVYAGKKNDLLMLRGNDLKYFELKKAVDANKAIVEQGRMQHGPWWLGYGFRWDKIQSHRLDKFSNEVETIIRNMRNNAQDRPWLIKDPRLCVLGKSYLEKMKNSVCVIVYRDALEVSLRMMGYNTLKASLSVKELSEIWEQYMVTSIASCMEANAEIVYVPYTELETNPYGLVEKLFSDLKTVGVENLTPFSRADLDAVIGGDVFVKKHQLRRTLSFGYYKDMTHFTTIISSDTAILSKRAKLVMNALNQNAVKELYDSGALDPLDYPWSLTEKLKRDTEPMIRKQAYVTMVSSEDYGYLTGAMVLATSIRRFDSRRDMVAMITAEVNDRNIDRILQRAGWIVKHVPKLKEPWFRKHPKCNSFNAGQIIRWGRMFSKLNLWTLEEYDKVVYSDTDTLYLRPVDRYFDLPLPFYAERSPSHRGINAGILVVKPSVEILNKMLEYGETHEPLQFWPSNQVGCTEQELLNRYWNGQTMQVKLNETRHADYLTNRFTDQVGRNDLKMNGGTIAHWLTTKCPKPWAIPAETLYKIELSAGQRRSRVDRMPPHCDHKVYEIWHHYYWSIQPAQDIVDKSKVPEGLKVPDSIDAIPSSRKPRENSNTFELFAFS